MVICAQIIDEALETLMKEPTVTPTGGSRRRATQRRREGLVPPVAWVNPTAEMELELEESGDDGGYRRAPGTDRYAGVRGQEYRVGRRN